jgi:alpha-L-fucosidase
MHCRFPAIILAFCGALVGCSHLSPAQKAVLTESKEARDVRMQWWRDARFGMFIHWGIYAVPAGSYKGLDQYGEWIMHDAKIPIPEYEQYARRFNPVAFDPVEWVHLAKEAGMQYIVITSKHHDGFSLWDSTVSGYNVVQATPFKRDILKELSDACRNEGVRFCTYHSIWDWHQGDALKGNYGTYKDTYLKPQLKELIQNYSPAIMWFDGEWVDGWTSAMAKDVYTSIRLLKPDIIINNRLEPGREGMTGLYKRKDAVGDYATPEQQIPEAAMLDLDWETNMTMNRHWGYCAADKDWKSSAELIWKLIDIRSKGGNFLLNVGPKADGTFPEESIRILKQIGRWMQDNREIVFETRPISYIPEDDRLRFFRSKDDLTSYVAFRKPAGQTVTIKEFEPLSEVMLLGYDKPLAWTLDRHAGLTVTLPGDLERSYDGAYCLKFKAKKAERVALSLLAMDQARPQAVDYNLFLKEASISIMCSSAGAEIHYTLDGSDPTRESPRYTVPVVIRETAMVKAMAAKDGLYESYIARAKFIKAKGDRESPDYILGEWTNPDKSAIITIYKEHGRYFGEITWSQEMIYVGMVIMKNFIAQNGEWAGGTIRDPSNDQTYRCKMWLKSKEILNIKGYIGVPWIGRAETWSRVVRE